MQSLQEYTQYSIGKQSCLNKKGFKLIEPLQTEQEIKTKAKFLFDSSRVQSPEVTRSLYSTGFCFLNSNSPRAANVRNKSDIRLKPISKISDSNTICCESRSPRDITF